jgi:hypothetical protein
MSLGFNHDFHYFEEYIMFLFCSSIDPVGIIIFDKSPHTDQ